MEKAAANLRAMLPQVLAAADLDSLRGIEGAAATAYFDVLDHMLLSRKEAFFFHGRSRRPPLDRVNAMLSFAYSLLAHDCASALESVGLDSYVGFLHRDRPGRQSLALDLMEELRPCMADRFVLTLVNNRMLRPEDFQMQDSGAVLLSDDGRRKFLNAWQERKQDTLTHPYLGEKLSWGMIPYAQALLLDVASRSPPSRGCGLKFCQVQQYQRGYGSPPSRGRGLKSRSMSGETSGSRSPPSRGRGLK